MELYIQYFCPVACSKNVLDISFESTTVYYSVAPISYAIDVSSSIPYRDVITSENSALSQQISTFSTNACSNVSGNAEERYDDAPRGNHFSRWIAQFLQFVSQIQE
ncbi:unnamed protein product, partial [Brugia timori]|uniref:Uncharacterized protein n=1 Tax=Brugia timori TaxID=42155 RepID=A0A0R3R6M5_9BILA